MQREAFTDELTYAQAYIKLRTYFDAFQANALTYCFEDRVLVNQQKRFQEVETALKTVMELVRAIPPPDGGCENGFYNCDGVCVPYPCKPV